MRPPAPAPVLSISVLMSCYNAARWLDEAIESVLRQTHTDFEFIIVDDGSKDDTSSILQRYSTSDARIVVITKPNSGLGDSLNVGIDQARGEWIARLDADDLCEPTRLARQLELARSNAHLVFVGSGLVTIDERGAKLGTHHYPTRHAELLRHLREVRKFPPHSSAMIRAAAVRAVGGYRTRIRRAQDWDLWLRLSASGDLACVDESLVRIRKHAGQISHEESGKRQRVDSRLSLTSYWLRQEGLTDPVSDDEPRFAEFRGWVESRLKQEGLHDVEAMRAQLNLLFNAAPNLPFAALRMADASLRHPAIVWRLILQRFTGENLARQMAREWASRESLRMHSERLGP